MTARAPAISIHSDRPVAVMGLGRSGLASIRALRRGGTAVLAWDDNTTHHADAIEAGAELSDLSHADFSNIAALVLAPGIPLTHPAPHPVVTRAQAAGVEVIGDIELLYRAQPAARYVGITGTNGKSTTTALIGHILNRTAAPDQPVPVGGNLGPTVLDFAEPRPGQPVVLELSSYQLDLTSHAVFTVACLLNITPDHLDRHGGMAGYIAAKQRIFRRGALNQHAVIGIDSEPSATVANELARASHWQVTRISSQSRIKGGVYVLNGVLYDDLSGDDEAVCDLMPVATLPGSHNWQNAAAAYACCRHLGLGREAIAEALAEFPGLAHRQQIVGRLGDISFVNDSKATNADAAGKALTSYPRLYWIAGGKPKDGGLSGLEKLVGSVVHAYLIGAAEADFADWCTAQSLPHSRCGTLDRAVADATAAALAAGRPAVVLLSPACASFDQFSSFEQRGQRFAAIVEDTLRHHQQQLEAQQ